MNTFYQKPNFDWLFSFCLVFLLSVSSNSVVGQTVAWDESIHGDLPSNNETSNTDFQSINLVPGVNTISGTVANSSISNGTLSSADAYSFTVPSGNSVTSYDVTVTLQNGASFVNLRTYKGSPLTYDSVTSVTSDTTQPLLPTFGGGPLPPGDYGLLAFAYADEGVVYDFSITLTPDAPPASIPTLSEWGLIVLALLFMTLGTLYLVQPNFRRSFEQK